MGPAWPERGQFDPAVLHRRLDLDLTAVGREQAEQLATRIARRLPHLTESPALFSSPLRRARHSANIVAARLGAQVIVLDELRELDVGDLDGRNDAEAWSVYSSVLTDWTNGHHDRRFPGGEDWHQLRSRLGAALGQIARATRGGTAVVIAHGANLRAARYPDSPTSRSRQRPRHRPPRRTLRHRDRRERPRSPPHLARRSCVSASPARPVRQMTA